MASTRIHLHPRPFAKSATGQAGSIGLPGVYCTGCWRPLHRELISRIADAVRHGRMDQGSVRCLRADCTTTGMVDLDFLMPLAEIIDIERLACQIPSKSGRGRPVRPQRCTGCGERMTARAWWIHTAGGRKCGATGARIGAG